LYAAWKAPLLIEGDKYELHWQNNVEPQFVEWRPQKTFVPDNVKNQFRNLPKKWLILDEFRIIFVIFYFFMFSISEGMTNLEGVVEILFSSPTTRRWSGKKDLSPHAGFGIETLTADEYACIKQCLTTKYCDYLCEKDSTSLADISRNLNELLPLDDPLNDPTQTLRKTIFGMQPRYLFAPDHKIAHGLKGLTNTINNFLKSGKIEVEETDNLKKISSHKILQLEYDVEKRIFERKFVSLEVMRILIIKIFEEKDKQVWSILNNFKNSYRSLYGSLFGGYMDYYFGKGLETLVRPNIHNIRDLDKLPFTEASYPKCVKKYLHHRKFKYFQLWYEDENFQIPLGLNPISENTVFHQAKDGCATVDNIFVLFRDGHVVVEFVQTTVRTDHPVSVAGFLPMLLFVKLVEFVNECKVTVIFSYFVPYTEF
jgi:hypothetical protein